MDWLYFIVLSLVVICAIYIFRKIFKKSKTDQALTGDKVVELKPQLQEILKAETPAPTPIAAPKKEISFKDRLKSGLSRSRSEVWGKLTNLFSGPGLTDDTIDSLEELLYSADIGTATVGELIEEVKKKAKEGNFTEESFKTFLFDFLKSKMKPIQENVDHSLYQFDKNAEKKTKVIMVVGVNGAGKTTTIGKLATKLRAQGASVVVGACDTFRAAAVDQLQVWCDRAGATMIRAKEGANPSGVGYDALQAAINQNADYCILDTAGRLHNKENLMDELAKSKNVLKKLDSSAPHQILLVIDAITGQNALRQAEEFHKTLGLTGLIFTKCDGSSKAGSAVTIVEQLKLPIAYIGVGESAEDLDVFNIDDYLHALLGL
ncbi:MAG: signal recognition particle-docking protein FtsY [Bacteriovorax sp.]|nr:signal recognition particle-docking protein FtsY [Bacteriovorax sp.]